jgi:hypothetical protein
VSSIQNKLCYAEAKFISPVSYLVSDSQPTNGSDKSNNKIENRTPFVAPNSTWEQGSVKEKQAAVSNCKSK